MSTAKRIFPLSAAVFALLASTVLYAGSSADNGSFEKPAAPEGGFISFKGENKWHDGWADAWNEIQIVRNCNVVDGQQALRVPGQGGVVGVEQVEVGKKYVITFWIAPNLNQPSAVSLKWPNDAHVAGTYKPEAYAETDWYKLPWKKCEYVTEPIKASDFNFKAGETTGNVYIIFETPKDNGILIDNVKVKEYRPGQK